jgi:5-methylcytosine-specific restriction protein A
MRAVAEWHGKTDDAQPPKAVKRRIVERQNGICALTGPAFAPGDKIEWDHITALWLGGRNCESNLQAVIDTAHKRKTKAEAKIRAKVYAVKDSHLGLKTAKRPIRSRGFARKPARTPKPMPPVRLLYRRGELAQPSTSQDRD